jgi:hypothetical protein
MGYFMIKAKPKWNDNAIQVVKQKNLPIRQADGAFNVPFLTCRGIQGFKMMKCGGQTVFACQQEKQLWIE